MRSNGYELVLARGAGGRQSRIFRLKASIPLGTAAETSERPSDNFLVLSREALQSCEVCRTTAWTPPQEPISVHVRAETRGHASEARTHRSFAAACSTVQQTSHK